MTQTVRYTPLVLLLAATTIALGQAAASPDDPTSVEARWDRVMAFAIGPNEFDASRTRPKGHGMALYELFMLGDAAQPLLIEALRHEEPLVRARAVAWLRRFGDAHAVDALVAACERESEENTRATILRAVGVLNSSREMDLVAASLEADPPASPFSTDRRLQRLVNAGDERAIPYLRTQLTDGVPLTVARPWRDLRELVALGDVEAIPALIAACEGRAADPDEFRHWNPDKAIRALAATGDDRAIPLIVRQLCTPREGAEFGALPCDPGIYGHRLVAPLLAAIQPGDDYGQGSIALALDQLHFDSSPHRLPPTEPSPAHVHLYGDALLDASYAGDSCAAYSGDARLRSVVAWALACLGDDGMESYPEEFTPTTRMWSPCGQLRRTATSTPCTDSGTWQPTAPTHIEKPPWRRSPK